MLRLYGAVLLPAVLLVAVWAAGADLTAWFFLAPAFSLGIVFGAFGARRRGGDADGSEETERFHALVEQSLVGIYIVEGGLFRYVNPEFIRIFGYASAAEIVGNIRVGDMVSPSDRALVAENLRRRAAGEVPEIRYEFTALRKDGTPIAVETHGRSFRYQGRPAVIGAILDVSARREALRASRESEERFAGIFHSSPVAIAIVKFSDLRLVDANGAFLALSGYEGPEILGRSPPDLWGDPEGRRRVVSALVKGGGASTLEMRIRRKDGEPRMVLASMKLISLYGARHILGVFTDLNEARRAREMEHLAYHDALTGLPNRLLLMIRLKQSIARSRRHLGKGAVLFLDLDRFKDVNDTLGHKAGDDLLRLVAGRLSGRLRESDTLARLGGDEFVVVLEDLASARAAGLVASELIDELKGPFRLAGGFEVHIGGSIGIAMFQGHGADAAALIQRADTALYEAKNGGGNTYRFHEEGTVVETE